jgi:CDP-6-deoxy-D-xylo-4-hexulose-3-dehydrase
MNDNFSWPLMNDSITNEDKKELINFINEPNVRFTNGKKVEEFELEWSKWLGTKYSLFVNSGSSANDITMMVLAEKYGVGEVIVPPLTWVSDISSVLRAGHTPVFVDIDPKTLALDPRKLKDAINPRTKAVFLTHVLGINGVNNNLLELLDERNILLFEDVCESHGATFNGQKAGTFGLASNFSFYFAHHMTTIEGGMISSNDEDFYNVARLMRSHGLVRESKIESFKEKFISEYPDLNPEFIFAYASHNMRSTEINAVLGLSQLKRLDQNIQKRIGNFKLFLDNLDPKIFEVNFSIEGNSNYALILILREKSAKIRDKVESILQESRIEYRRGMAGGGNQLRQPYLKKYKINQVATDFSVVEHIHFFSWYIGNNEQVTEFQINSLCKSLSSENLL